MQTIAHPQMVLVTSSVENDKNVTSTEKFEPHPSTSGLCDNLKVSNSAEQINECDILLAPRLLVDGENSSGPRKVTLDGHHQVVVLAHCLLLKEGARVDDLQNKFPEKSVVTCISRHLPAIVNILIQLYRMENGAIY